MQKVMKKLFTLLLFCQALSVQANEFELQDYRRKIKPIGDNLGTALGYHRESINSLHSRLNQFQEKFNRMGGVVQTKPITPVRVENHYRESTDAPVPHDSTDSVVSFETVSETSVNDQFESNQLSSHRQIGFYVLPFVALQSPGDFRHKPLDMLIEQEMGFSTGWRVGLQGPHFFIEGELAYSRNKLRGLVDIPGIGPPLSPVKASGESEGFGVLLNAGGNFELTDQTSVLIGAGFGAVNQEIGFDMLGSLLEEEDTLFTYQIFSGLNYDLSDHFRVGLRYRWMKVGEMEVFSNRGLHIAELSMGYIF